MSNDVLDQFTKLLPLLIPLIPDPAGIINCRLDRFKQTRKYPRSQMDVGAGHPLH